MGEVPGMRPKAARTSCALAIAVAGFGFGAPRLAAAATWQHCVPVEVEGRARAGGASAPGKAFLWLPPASETLRGALVGGRLGIELELALDPEVRKACAECDLAIVYFDPHISAVFHWWEEGSRDAERWLGAFAALAERSGHPEVARVPWIVMGHSTAGIFARNVAYRWPERVAAVLHIMSGNIHQEEHLPPGASLAGVPFFALNGQFETYGPEGGLRPELGRETQWVFVRKDLERLRRKDPRHLASLWVDPGNDHFHGSPALAFHAALLIRKTAEHRIPAAPAAPGSAEGGSGEPVACLPIAPEAGWLTDEDLYEPAAEPAPYAEYRGDRFQASWHYDEELARASARHHAKLGAHQCLSVPEASWVEGEDWTLRVSARSLDALPAEYGGSAGGKPCGRAAGPIAYLAKRGEPVERIGPDTFRVLRAAAEIHIAAAIAGDDRLRPTIRWGTLKIPAARGRPQGIEFPPPPDLLAAGGSAALLAKATSGLPVSYEVDYGPAVVRGGTVSVSEVPVRAPFPLECRLTAHQIGRRSGDAVAPAAPASATFRVVEGERTAEAPGGPPIEVVTASYVSLAGDSDLEGAAVGPDGSLYLVGNAPAPAAGEEGCGSGFVARLSNDGRRVLRRADFPPGSVILTTVAAGAGGVYVAGYASERFEVLFASFPGFLREYPLRADLEAAAREAAAGKKDPIAGRPGLGRRGAPCVVRFPADLSTPESATYLEGWQQVWEKVRVYRKGQENVGNFVEHFWQPTHVAILEGGDVLVCHDGGYFRVLDEKDEKLAKGRSELLERLKFYDVPDHVSRLSPDLSRRVAHARLYAPRTDPGVAAALKDGWGLPHYGNPRTHRMRLDARGNVYLSGWSASETKSEPWWSPYLFRVDPATGACTWRAYDYDPLSGRGNRLGGQVSDTAVVAIAPEEDGTVLAALIADGGNSVMEWSPKADGSPFGPKPRGPDFGVKLVHFWGQVHRLDPNTKEGLARARVGPWAWVSDIAAAPGKHCVATGRWNLEFGWSADAWDKGSPVENPNGFLRVYSPDLEAVFTTSLPGVRPFELVRVSATRFVVVGEAHGGAAPVKDAPLRKAPGRRAGWYMVFDWKRPPGGPR